MINVVSATLHFNQWKEHPLDEQTLLHVSWDCSRVGVSVVFVFTEASSLVDVC